MKKIKKLELELKKVRKDLAIYITMAETAAQNVTMLSLELDHLKEMARKPFKDNVDSVNVLKQTSDIGNRKFYFVFGNNEQCRFKDEYVIVMAVNFWEAIIKFQKHYSDPECPGRLSGNRFFCEEEWKLGSGDYFDRFKDKEPIEIIC